MEIKSIHEKSSSVYLQMNTHASKRNLMFITGVIINNITIFFPHNLGILLTHRMYEQRNEYKRDTGR